MDEESFVDKKGMRMIVENSNTALLSPTLIAEKSEQFANCKIKGIWSFPLGQLSMVIAKKSPYTIFMKQLIFDMIQSGPLNLINKRWSVEKPICKLSSEVGPVAPEKIITAFFAIVTGMIFSLILMILEKIWKKKKSDKLTETELVELFQELQVHIQQIEQIGKILSDSEMKSMIARLQKHIQEKDGNLVNSDPIDDKTNLNH